MLNSFITWLRGLSFVNKAVLGAVAVGTTGVIMTTPPTEQQSTSLTKPINSQKLLEVQYTFETKTENIPYERITKEDSLLEKGRQRVDIQGINGVKEVGYKIGTKAGIEVSREKVSNTVTKESVAEVTVIGTYVAPAVSFAPRQNCDPNYTPCISNVSGDLDCPDIGHQVTVIGVDRYRLDRDGDGIGCDSY